MKLYCLFVALLPALVQGGFVVKVHGDSDNLQFQLLGEEIDTISDRERDIFQLTDNNLKRGSRNSFGARPSDAYLKEPTPWGLYNMDGFNQVTRHLKPVSARVITINTEPAILRYQCFHNNYTEPISTRAAISQTVVKTYSQSWSREHELTASYSLGVEISVLFAKSKTETTLSYKGTWGESESKTESETIGASAGISIMLPPGEMVEGILQASKGRLIIEVDYEASLQGHVAVNYEDTYQGHHFWGLDINEVMRGAGLETTRKYSGTVEVGFYANSKVTINDPICNGKVCHCEHSS